MTVHPILAYTSDRHARARLAAGVRAIRSATERLAAPISPEEAQVQSMPDASPTKWHLAHTTWFFENFVLSAFDKTYRVFQDRYDFFFNSYYETVGPRWTRAQRGLLTRPLLSEILAYREHVTDHVLHFIETASDALWVDAAPLIELGLHHEQQHQELICTDIKHALSMSADPWPVYGRALDGGPAEPAPALGFLEVAGGLVEIGAVPVEFVFDNELPRHRHFLDDFALADRVLTNGEVLAFIQDGGYESARLWLSDGWAWVQENGHRHPAYWRRIDGAWFEHTLHGLIPLDPNRPACHLTGYEAFALAEWFGARLPHEQELELAAPLDAVAANFLFEDEIRHPRGVHAPGRLAGLAGGVWEWTQSAYSPYPGFAAPPGAVGEYNGKFMSKQLVLRGGSCATPSGHARPTYRNFFPAEASWQFTGVRLARR